MQTTYQQRYCAYQIRAIFQKGAIYTSLVRLQLGQVTVFWYGFLVIIKINTDWMGLPSKRQVFKNITVNPTQLKKSVSSDFIILGQNIHSNFWDRWEWQKKKFKIFRLHFVSKKRHSSCTKLKRTSTDFENFWRRNCWDKMLSKMIVIPPLLTNVSALPGEILTW